MSHSHRLEQGETRCAQDTYASIGVTGDPKKNAETLDLTHALCLIRGKNNFIFVLHFFLVSFCPCNTGFSQQARRIPM
jgi:hypothetical protein